MNLITPEYISNYISFQYGDSDWTYSQSSAKDIPKIQAEGSAKLWNILEEKNVALLADEVGMGKTYQALAIMITLWLQKPNAKIIIYAPNENVALKWKKEYETFIRYHYKFSDDKIKSSINGEPLRQAIYCENQLELLKYVNQGWPSLYICKTSSLSNFLSKKITQQELDKLKIDIVKDVDDNSSDVYKSDWMYRFAKKCNDFIYKKLSISGKSPFDLIIFDEAHYLRNANADTNRGLVAHTFFAKRDVNNYDGQYEPIAFLAQKALLLTATPNHTSSRNIESIVSIFNNKYKGVKPEEILNQICVRRFRRLNGKTKHQYRKEIDEPVDMTSMQEKLFFALYQRSLVKYKAEQFKKNKTISKSNNPYRLLFGYLEGFEFLPNKTTEKLRKSNDKVKSADFEERDDKKVIQELSQAHFDVYKKYPIHPKYNKTVENLSPVDTNNLHPDKKVVFVRRIPSVYELSRRVIEEYDNHFTKILEDSNAFPESKHFKNWNEIKLRKHFATKTKTAYSENEDIENEDKHDSEIIEKEIHNVSSKYHSLFTKKKDGKFKTTDCFNFRNRFLIDFNLFSIFMQPGMDYLAKEYVFEEYQYQGDKRNYSVTARRKRFDSLDAQKQDHLFSYFSLNQDSSKNVDTVHSFPTLFTIWLNTIQISEDKFLMDAFEDYKSFTEIEKEAFTNYVSKGLLFASSYIIVFYANFKKIISEQNLKPEEIYLKFCKTVENDMLQRGLAFLIAKAATTFKIFYKKELNLTEENLLKEKWIFLSNTSPVYPVCAETNRNNILKAFNTPFYPNVLVATSVLQEGVDLHYHCNEIIHYGLAWTQGDNEQRVGRVDRLNGKMENNLRESETSILPIHYPYLKNTIDEDQTARFILRKKEAEKLIDQFIPIEQSNEINFLERMNESDWKSSFNSPILSEFKSIDPFPVEYCKDFKKANLDILSIGNSSASATILEPILSALSQYFKEEFYIYENNNQNTDNKVFAIKHVRLNNRNQPIIATFNYLEPGLHILDKPVYYLRIKTPIYRRGYRYDNLESFGKQKVIYDNNPLIKIGFDNNRRDEFKYFVFADLPLFYSYENEINLSANELIHVVNDVISFADDLEDTYTRNKDIKNEQIIQGTLNNWNKATGRLTDDRGAMTNSSWLQTKNYLFKEQKRSFNADLLNHLYHKNNSEIFVKYYRKKVNDFRCVGMYKNDVLDEEMKLYDYIFNKDDI